MARKTNIFPLFNGSLMRPFVAAALFWALLFTNVSLCAQDIMATYDVATGVLTIDNKWDLIVLRKSEDMPRSMQKAIESGENPYYIGTVEPATFENVSMDEVKVYNNVIYYVEGSGGKFDVPKTIPIKVIKQKDAFPDSQEFASEKQSAFHKYLPFVIAGVSVVILLFVIFLAKWFSEQKKKKRMAEERRASSQVMQVVEEETSDCSVGLNHVYQNPDNYYTVDMHVFFRDTAVEKVYLSRDIIKRINSYFKTYLDNSERTPETGCYLIGVWERLAGTDDRYNVSIEEMVTPGDDMIPGEFSLSFGLKIGIDLGSTIRNLCEKTHRDYVQTAWMHSHPGLGLFLSSHDLAVQKQLTYPDEPKRLLAIVIDTNTPDWNTVFFSAKNNGMMNNKEDLLQVVSFDTLLEWSRHKTVSASSLATEIENTFNVTSADGVDLFAFTAKAVNQMDDVIGADHSDEVYGFYAIIQQTGSRKVRLITECETNVSNRDNAFVVKTSDNSTKQGMTDYTDLLNSYDFGVVYSEEQQSYLLYRNGRQEICTLSVSLKEMKEWTRRKRV